MEVKLLRHTPEPEKTVAMSARLCYSPVGAAQLEETMSDEQAAKLVRKLVEMGHFSTFGTCYIYFRYRRRFQSIDAPAGASPYRFLFTAIAALCKRA